MTNGRPGVSQTDGMYESSSTVNKQSFFQLRGQPGGVPESEVIVRVTCKIHLVVFSWSYCCSQYDWLLTWYCRLSVRPSVRLSVCLSVTLRTVAKRYVGLLQQKCLNKWIIGLTAHSSMILHRLTPYIDPFPSSSLPPKLSRFKSDQDDIWRIVLQVNVHELAESDFWWRHTFKMAAMTSWQLTFARCLSAEREWRHWVAISATVPDP